MSDIRVERPFNKITVSYKSRKKRGKRLKDNPWDYTLIKLANITFLFCIIFEVVGIMTILFFGTVGAQMSIYFMTFLFSLFLWRKHRDEIDIPISFKKLEPGKMLHISLITVCGVPIALLLNALAGVLSNAGADSAEDVNTYPILMAIVVYAVVPAVVEEFVFRGVILGAYSKVDVKAGILISSLFFALLHFSFGSVLYGFFFGLLFAIVRLATDNLTYTIVMHCLFNTVNVIVSYMRFGEITIVPVFGILVIAIVGFVLLLIIFFRKNINNTSRNYPVGRYKFWKLITKEGYITMAICMTVMCMLLTM
ncbi:MAG: CPBP family intramembrane metalloprotease [Eubacterium sp.]|nr:CPBP family intramembrane metalloprotease [Eubacterium sp.]